MPYSYLYSVLPLQALTDDTVLTNKYSTTEVGVNKPAIYRVFERDVTCHVTAQMASLYLPNCVALGCLLFTKQTNRVVYRKEF